MTIRVSFCCRLFFCSDTVALLQFSFFLFSLFEQLTTNKKKTKTKTTKTAGWLLRQPTTHLQFWASGRARTRLDGAGTGSGGGGSGTNPLKHPRVSLGIAVNPRECPPVVFGIGTSGKPQRFPRDWTLLGACGYNAGLAWATLTRDRPRSGQVKRGPTSIKLSTAVPC